MNNYMISMTENAFNYIGAYWSISKAKVYSCCKISLMNGSFCIVEAYSLFIRSRKISAAFSG